MLEQFFIHQRHFALHLRKEPIEIRINSLTALEKNIRASIPKIVKALADDFAKPEAETLLSEIYPVLEEISYTKKHLKKWSKPRKVSAAFTLFGTKNYILAEPRGVCLIIAPWNYPFQLAMLPLVSAIAAGNCVILKPSEVTTHTSSLIAKIIAQTFSDEHVKVIEGGVETSQELLLLPFDHIFFTGSTQVGKIIMSAASKHLSSVTLELGGKSPTIVDDTANLEIAAEKIIWGKFFNAGQTCIAPDYLFVHREVMGQFKKALIKYIEIFYGKTETEKQKS
ncbi:MAG: aldehyde dehydrogenase family protein, partial [Bdellovibrio sp.]